MMIEEMSEQWRALLASEARIQRNVCEGMRREVLCDDVVQARELLAERLDLMAVAEPHVAFLDELVRLGMGAFESVALELHANVAFGYGYRPGSDTHRERLLTALRERMAQAAQIYAIDVALGGSSLDAPAIDEDTRRAIPDACDVDDPCSLCDGTGIRRLSHSTFEGCPRCAPRAAGVPDPFTAEERAALAAENDGRPFDDRSPRGADVFRSEP